MDNRWVVPLHCDGRERGGEEEARFPRRPLQTRLVRAEDGELWPLLPPLGTVLPFNLLQLDIYHRLDIMMLITLSEKIRKVEAWPVMLNRNLHPSV